MKFCPNCGNRLQSNARFCPNCGYDLTSGTVGDDSYFQRSRSSVQSNVQDSTFYSQVPKTSFAQAWRLFWGNLNNSRARSTRAEFWYGFLVVVVVAFIAAFVIQTVFPIPPVYTGFVRLIFYECENAFMWDLQARRLHDTGSSAKDIKWAHIGSIFPVIGLAIYLMEGLPSSKGFGNGYHYLSR